MGGESRLHPLIRMSKIDKLLLILNMLYQRRSVSLNTIITECCISRRTAYRYLHSIEEARFPLLYDEKVHGYTLLEKGSALSHLSTEEAAMVFFGTLLLEKMLQPGQLEMVRSARIKLEERLSERVKEMFELEKKFLWNSSMTDSLKEYLVASMIKLATLSDCTIQLRYQKDEHTELTTALLDPKLLFEKEWKITGRDDSRHFTVIPIRLVNNVELIGN